MGNESGKHRMHEAPETWHGSNEKVSKDWQTYRSTDNPVYEPKGSEFMDKECSNCEKVRPFRSATGVHRECGHLF